MHSEENIMYKLFEKILLLTNYCANYCVNYCELLCTNICFVKLFKIWLFLHLPRTSKIDDYNVKHLRSN